MWWESKDPGSQGSLDHSITHTERGAHDNLFNQESTIDCCPTQLERARFSHCRGAETWPTSLWLEPPGSTFHWGSSKKVEVLARIVADDFNESTLLQQSVNQVLSKWVQTCIRMKLHEDIYTTASSAPLRTMRYRKAERRSCVRHSDNHCFPPPAYLSLFC